jgi:hypothetical protein
MLTVSPRRSMVNVRSCLSGAKCTRRFGRLAPAGTDVTSPIVPRVYEQYLKVLDDEAGPKAGWSCGPYTTKSKTLGLAPRQQARSPRRLAAVRVSVVSLARGDRHRAGQPASAKRSGRGTAAARSGCLGGHPVQGHSSNGRRPDWIGEVRCDKEDRGDKRGQLRLSAIPLILEGGCLAWAGTRR